MELVPAAAGVYYIHGDKLEAIKIAESKIVNNKRRSVLKALSPLPIVTGKQTLELDGEAADLRVSEKRPEFYFRLSTEERFAIIKLTPTKKGARIVGNHRDRSCHQGSQREPRRNRYVQETGRRLLFKIWPEKDLDPGEYALIEYTEGKVNPQVWDFAVK